MSETGLLSLDRVNPDEAWQPWEPGGKDRWDLKWAGHLFRRAALGANLAELCAAERAGLPATLEDLLQGQPGADERLAFLTQTGAIIARQENTTQLRGWWLYVMLHSLHPLREKMTLFWHNHFATSIAKVRRAALMFQQNVTLRSHALGQFGPFLQDMSRDPAMLVWLDSNANVKGRANENYARELMELFSLGVGNYTEQDVREGARAFTGWHTDDDKFDFNPRFHDDGDKTILGRTGKWNGDDMVRILLEQPVAARFLVRKLYAYLISETQVPPDSLLEPLADSFRKSDYDIRTLVRRMLGSRHFFSTHAYRQRIKSPVEFAVGAIWATTDRVVPQGGMVSQLEAMGQPLFAPPNVKGWRGGEAWLNTSTVLARHNFAQVVASAALQDSNRYRNLSRREQLIEAERLQAEEAQRQAEEARLRAEGKPVPPRPVPPPPPAAPNMDPATLVHHEKATRPADVVAVLVDLLLQGDVSDAARARLVSFVAEGKPTGDAFDRRIRETAHAIMTMPEYQLA